MQSQLNSTSGHMYPAITLGDSSWLHAGDVHIHGPHTDVKAEHKCHQVFKTSTYEDFKNRNIDRAEGTCQWVLNHPHFRSWREGVAQNLLWISADPGCGKSVLAKALIDRDLNEDGLSTICYFFKDNEIQDNLATALCAILHQLFAQQSDLIRHALPVWHKNDDKLQKETKEMWRILKSCMVDPAARPIICIFDALDECRDADRRHLISLLCDLLSPVSGNPPEYNINFLVTSRPYDNVQRWFAQSVSQWPHIRLRGEDQNEQIRGEINMVIDQNIDALAKDVSLSPRHQEQLRQQLLSMQHRTYLWLYLAVEDIRETYRSSLYPEQEEIESLPASVEQAYEAILRRISAKQQPIARKVLLIIAGARRPLTIGEMALALAAANPKQKSSEPPLVPEMSHLEKQIREWCGLFVFIQSSTLFLIHQTAKEFLLLDHMDSPPDTSIWRGSFSLMGLETEMAKMCVMYLRVFEHNVRPHEFQQSAAWLAGREIPKTGLPIIDAETNFTEYCLEHWISHYEDYMAIENPQFADGVLELYKTQSVAFHLWFRRFWNTSRRGFDWLDLLSQHAIAFTGHLSILNHMQKHYPIDVDALDGLGYTALWFAANQGHIPVVRRLLDLGANVLFKQRLHGSTLYTAAENGHSEVVELLINNGASANGAGGFLGPALHVASARGHGDVVRILLSEGASMDVRGNFGSTALHLAIENGRLQIAQLLVDHGADINIEDDLNQTALYLAASWGHAGVVRKSLEKGDDADMLMLIASKYARPIVVKMTLERGAHVNHSKPFGKTALIEVTEMISKKMAAGSRKIDTDVLLKGLIADCEKTLEILLSHGANVHAQDTHGYNALHYAIASGLETVVRLLLSRGADVNSRYDREGVNALTKALWSGYTKVIDVLLAGGADINTTDPGGCTALQRAAFGGHVKAVELIHDRGADIDVSPTALHIAAEQGHAEVIQILINRGVHFDHKDKRGETALEKALCEGHGKVVELLLARGAQIDHDNKDQNTALHCAAARGYKEVVQFQLDRGANINQQNINNERPLHRATNNGHQEVVQILLRWGAASLLKDLQNNIALDVDPDEVDETMVQLLRMQGRKRESLYERLSKDRQTDNEPEYWTM